MPTSSTDHCLRELKIFVRAGQLERLGKIMPNIFREYEQPTDTATRLLWQAGLDMDDIKYVLSLHKQRPSESAPWTGQSDRVAYPRDLPPPWMPEEEDEECAPLSVRHATSSKRRRFATCAA